MPALDQPPLELENSAKIGWPAQVRTTPRVASTAAVVLAGSRPVTTPARLTSRVPPKTWQAVVSQMSYQEVRGRARFQAE